MFKDQPTLKIARGGYAGSMKGGPEPYSDFAERIVRYVCSTVGFAASRPDVETFGGFRVVVYGTVPTEQFPDFKLSDIPDEVFGWPVNKTMLNAFDTEQSENLGVIFETEFDAAFDFVTGKDCAEFLGGLFGPFSHEPYYSGNIRFRPLPALERSDELRLKLGGFELSSGQANQDDAVWNIYASMLGFDRANLKSFADAAPEAFGGVEGQVFQESAERLEEEGGAA